MNKKEAAAQSISRLSYGYLFAAAIRTVLTLRIPDLLTTGAMSVEQLGRQVGVSPDPLLRVMRALAGVGVFKEVAGTSFELTEMSKLLRDTPGSMRAEALWMTGPLHLRLCEGILDTVRTGVPAIELTTGLELFDYLGSDHAWAATYHQAISSDSSDKVIRAVLKAYDFSEFETAVDVGGGYGQLMLPLLHQYPRLRGVIFDREDVVDTAKDVVARSSVHDRCRICPGDFFAEVPDGADVYLLKHILHDWNDERALQVLRNVRRSVKHAGVRLLIMETVVGKGVNLGFGDVHLMLTLRGRERTLLEFEQLLGSAGFQLTRTIETSTYLRILEGQPCT